MDVYVARQPIFDRRQNVAAYEILFRNGMSDKYDAIDGDKATLDVITNSFFSIGMEKVTEGKPAFINFTEKLLTNDAITILPNKLFTIEILETVEPTEEVLETCRRLKNLGYTIALDDFIFHPKYEKLIEIADIIKVDFRLTEGIERKNIVDKVKNKNVKFLAEKVETYEEFNDAKEFGYELFQGFFFSRPVVLKAKEIPPQKFICMQIIKELGNDMIDFDKLSELIAKDVSLSVKLLKLINSSAFGLKGKVTSMKHALTMLGEKEVTKWLYIATVKNLKDDKPDEVIKYVLVRAKLCELIAIEIGMEDKAFNSYLTGILSMMNVLLDRNLSEAIEGINIPNEVRDALLMGGNIYSDILGVIRWYEKANWEVVNYYLDRIHLDGSRLTELYVEALNWAKDM